MLLAKSWKSVTCFVSVWGCFVFHLFGGGDPQSLSEFYDEDWRQWCQNNSLQLSHRQTVIFQTTQDETNICGALAVQENSKDKS